jgi:tRNA-Thr(GGU) m(6)t(6)A37 methyltransferase TsaA
MLRFIGVVERVEDEISIVRIFDEFGEGLKGLNTFSHLIILYWFHLREEEEERRVLKVVPRRHPGAPEVGVFASRSPSRPNPVGLCVVELVKMEGNILVVRGLDAFEGSPVIDIKPYIPRADAFPEVVVPEWALRGPKT